MRIALAGNPNSGKTTMYNALTGKSEKVGNWAGVTVDKNEHPIKKNFYDKDKISVVDLPGAYSMSPFTSEESVTSSYIKNEKLDAIINIVDATNLSRSLFFTTQLLELGVPVVVALNKADINEKKKTEIDTKLLSEKLGCPVFETVSTNSGGLKEVVLAAVGTIGKGQKPPFIQENVNLSDKDSVEKADRARFAFVNKIVKEVETKTVRTNEKNNQDKIDAILTNKWVGIPIFALVMFLVFDISQSSFGPFIADTLVAYLEVFQGWIGSFFENANPLLSALLIDGVIGGVIAVIGFLPLVMVMYFLIALLEDCGYMARVSVVLDPIFKKVGLSGKSVISFIIGTGCSIPGIMACRTIRNERERRATAMLTPFMPCGAKLPVIALFAGAFFENASWVGTLMYFAGIALILFGALIVNKITGQKAKKSFFIIELPEYKFPSIWRAVKSMCGRGLAYIVKASTIILLCNTAIEIMQSFDWRFALVENPETSILASIANPFAYILIPVIGFHTWQFAAAAIAGFIAKENVVATVAVCYVLTDVAGELGAAVPELTAVAALAYLMFNLFSPPCFAAIGAMNSEMKSAKWLWGGIGLQLAIGYTVGYFVYQIGTFITTGAFGAGVFPGFAIVVAIIGIILYMCADSDQKADKSEDKPKAKKTPAGKM